jgi:uncharacterized membrane protein YqjE
MTVSGSGGRDDPGRYVPDEPGDRYRVSARSDDRGETSLGELFGSLTNDLSDLVRSEMELARVELRDEAAKAGRAAGMLGGGAVVAYLALTLVAFAAAWGLAEVVDAGWAFLIVGVVVGAAGALLVLKGRDRLREVRPVPDQTMETLKEDARWARAQVK